MKVGILSDTHIHKGRSLPRFVWDVLADTDMIIHAGDIVTESFLQELELVASVVAVKGNCDWQIDHLPEKTVIEIDYLRIGIIHGYQGKGKNTAERAYNAFLEDHVDVIIFGHSHQPYQERVNGIMLFNPGSTTEKRGQTEFSMGLMTIENNQYEIKHITF